jgi:hypothetical protein
MPGKTRQFSGRNAIQGNFDFTEAFNLQDCHSEPQRRISNQQEEILRSTLRRTITG